MPHLKVSPLPTYGSHYTLKEFVARCQDGSFVDYDGYGNYATQTGMFDKIVYPLDVTKKNYRPKPEFTHVMWFNR